MKTLHRAGCMAAAVLLALGLGGCVYAPPYAYDAYPDYGYPGYAYPGYGYPTYVGPPVNLDFGFSFYDRHHHHGGYRGWGGHRGGWGYRGGGWHGGRGRH